MFGQMGHSALRVALYRLYLAIGLRPVNAQRSRITEAHKETALHFVRVVNS